MFRPAVLSNTNRPDTRLAETAFLYATSPLFCHLLLSYRLFVKVVGPLVADCFLFLSGVLIVQSGHWRTISVQLKSSN